MEVKHLSLSQCCIVLALCVLALQAVLANGGVMNDTGSGIGSGSELPLDPTTQPPVTAAAAPTSTVATLETTSTLLGISSNVTLSVFATRDVDSTFPLIPMSTPVATEDLAILTATPFVVSSTASLVHVFSSMQVSSTQTPKVALATSPVAMPESSSPLPTVQDTSTPEGLLPYSTTREQRQTSIQLLSSSVPSSRQASSTPEQTSTQTFTSTPQLTSFTSTPHLTSTLALSSTPQPSIPALISTPALTSTPVELSTSTLQATSTPLPVTSTPTPVDQTTQLPSVQPTSSLLSTLPEPTSFLPASSSTPVVTNPERPNTGAEIPLPAIAGVAAGGFVVVLLVIMGLICAMCCCVRRRKNRYVLKTGGKDGTTAVNDYKLVEFNDGVNALSSNNKIEDVTTTDTFGIKSPPPLQVDIKGQKFMFPDIPSPTDSENLPALIIVNPVKPGEMSSNTLPTRKKNKITTDADPLMDLFSGQVKLSKSTSEINKEPDAGTPVSVTVAKQLDVSEQGKTGHSPLYDIPRTFKPSSKTVDQKETKDAGAKKEDPSSSPGYVTMESLPKQPSAVTPTVASVDTGQQAPVLAKKSSVVDRLAPKPATETTESIYDNARLLKSKPLVSSDQLSSKPVATTDAYSLYDVPRKILQTQDKAESTPVAAKDSKPETSATMESLYDIPKKQVPLPKKTSAKTVSATLEGTSDDDNTKSPSKPLILPKPGSLKSNPTASKPPVDKPTVLPKPATGTAPESVSAAPPILPTNAPSVLPKSAVEKPAVLPKPASDKPTALPMSGKEESNNAPKPDVAQKPTVSPRPQSKPEDANQSANKDSVKVSAADNDSISERSSSEPATDSPSHDSTDSSTPVPKPCPKARKGTQRQQGMPQNLMQELFAKQNSKSKLTEENGAAPAKPPTKPKPTVK